MIRGPVLPHSRESLWSLVAGRLDTIERGLTLVSEALDCSSGHLGPVDGLARDAVGAPVLLVLAVEGDALLIARALAAADFLHRVGDALQAAIPEAMLCTGVAGRIVVIATDGAALAVEQLARQRVEGLHVCRLEPFRIGGSERFAVRWLSPKQPVAAAACSVPEFAVPAHLHDTWCKLHALCLRIDAGVRVDGDRYRRRITWNGHLLAEVKVVDGGLHGILADGVASALVAPIDVRMFSDQLLRSYARLAGLTIIRPDADSAPALPEREVASRHAANGRSGHARETGESLRSVAAAARLSPEEYSALGGPTLAVGGETEGAATADDVARIVAAQESPWLHPGRTD